MSSDSSELLHSFQTSQIHAGHRPDPTTNAIAVPIYATTAFTFNDAQHDDDIGAHKVNAYPYSRTRTPLRSCVRGGMTQLEGGHASVATATGQAPTLLAILALAKAGDNFVTSTKLYGGTFQQFNHFLPRIGITTKFVLTSDPADYEKAIDENTKGIFVESITNPLLEVLDLEALADVAHRNGIPLLVDNTFGAGGYLIPPIDHGADIVLHSATKWIGGHGTTLGGVVVSSGRFPFENNPRFPEFNEPLPGYHGLILCKQFGPSALTAKMRMETLRDMDPSLVSHPSHELAKKYLPRGSGGMLSFALKGPKPSNILAQEFIDATKLAIHAPNVGACNLSTQLVRLMLSSRLSSLSRMGRLRTLIRVSVELEDIKDIIQDFKQAIEAVVGPPVVVE